jgi:hypothetical protein
MRIITIALFQIVMLLACSKGDDVPKIDDPHNVVVNGQKMTQRAFLEKYCVAKVDNETCGKVSHAMEQDATHGVVPRF